MKSETVQIQKDNEKMKSVEKKKDAIGKDASKEKLNHTSSSSSSRTSASTSNWNFTDCKNFTQAIGVKK
jgi:hypothetical protein